MKTRYWYSPPRPDGKFTAPGRRRRHVPSWLTRSIQSAIGEGRLPPIPRSAPGQGWYYFQHLNTIERTGHLWDHWGSELTPDGSRILVSEPYAILSEELLAEVKRLADLLRCGYTVTTDSAWSPPSTIKITLHPAGQTPRQAL